MYIYTTQWQLSDSAESILTAPFACATSFGCMIFPSYSWSKREFWAFDDNIKNSLNQQQEDIIAITFYKDVFTILNAVDSQQGKLKEQNNF